MDIPVLKATSNSFKIRLSKKDQNQTFHPKWPKTLWVETASSL